MLEFANVLLLPMCEVVLPSDLNRHPITVMPQRARRRVGGRGRMVEAAQWQENCERQRDRFRKDFPNWELVCHRVVSTLGKLFSLL